jgi:phosphopantothenoylcysteine decarboxylase/phosphopantothenate--cysteine ligase
VKPVFLITAGPTREYLDPVRFLSNPSSGRMGYAIARAARARGSKVILVSGPVSLDPPKGVRTIHVESAEEMRREVMRARGSASIVIMAAAVADYKPQRRSAGKIKKGTRRIDMPMVRTRDILAELGRKKGNSILVGFAAETSDIEREAKRKLGEKNLDLIVANDVSRLDSGFASDYNRAVIIDRMGKVARLPRMRKDALARIIVQRCLDLVSSSPQR